MQKRIPYLTVIGLALLLIVGLTFPACFEGMGSSLAGDSTMSPPTIAWEQAAARYPDDWRAQHAWCDFAVSGEEAIARYDRVIERFPDQAALYAGRVIRYCQIIDFNRPEEFQLSGDPVPIQVKQADPKLLGRGLQAARAGIKVEPDNAFFRYAAASFLFGLQRDMEALDEVAAGAKLSRYDAHGREMGLNRLRVVEQAGGSPVESMTSVAMILLPHLAHQRRVARMVCWCGRQASREGSHALALEWFGHASRMGEQVIDGANTLIEGLVGAAIVQVGMLHKDPLQRLPEGATEAEHSQERRNRAGAFASYARAHGRDDLAEAALRRHRKAEITKTGTSALLYPDDEAKVRALNLRDPYPGFSRYFRAILRQAGLVVHAVIGLVLLVLSLVYTRLARKRDHISWDVALGLGVICWLPALVLLLLTSRKGRTPFGWPSGYGDFREEEMVMAIALPTILAIGLWLGRLMWLRLRSGQWRSGAPSMMPRTALGLTALPLIAYAGFLFPFRQAENAARVDIRRMASEEMKIVRAAAERR